MCVLSSLRVAMAKQSGKVTLSETTLQINFGFSKRRFEKIKRFGRVSYDKSSKSWKLPIIDLAELQQTSGFRCSEIKYEASAEELEQAHTLGHQQYLAARQRIVENPFEVTADDIFLVQPEVVLILSRNRKSIRAKLRKYSRRSEWLTSQSGIFYLESERCYRVDAATVPYLIKQLRDNEISFAVEESASKKLREGSQLRKTYGDVYPTPAELERGMMFPYLHWDETKNSYLCVGLEIDELKLLLPQFETTRQRRAHLAQMTAKDTFELLACIAQRNDSVYLSATARQALDASQGVFFQAKEKGLSSLPNGAICLLANELVWFRTFDNRLALLLPAARKEEISHALNDAAAAIEWRTFSSQWHCSQVMVPTEMDCVEIYDRLAKNGEFAGILETAEARRLLEELKGNMAQRLTTQRYRKVSDCEVPELCPELAAKLFAHQRVAVRWMLDSKMAFLGDDMGLGKTLSVLATAKALFDADEVDFLLVIAPTSLLRNWQRECSQWVSPLSMLRLPDTKAKRTVFLRKLTTYGPDWIDALVVNYEAARLPDVAEALEQVCAERRTILCVDESQRTKNPQSKTFQALVRFAELAERRILLSGTPTPRDICDIWAQMRILDGGQRFGDNYFEWLAQVAELGNKWSEYAIKRFKPKAVEHTISRVQEVLLRRSKEEVVNLPEKLFSVRDVRLKGDQKKRYDSVCKELQVQLSTVSGETYTREIESILERFLRAVQIASNPRLVDETWEGQPAKFIELDDIVQEVVFEQRRKLVIWTNYRKNVEELVQRYSQHGCAGFSGETSAELRSELIQKFQDKSDNSLSILVAIPAAGGVGITLTAAQIAVYLDKTWNAEHWMQSVDRVHRIGQKGTVQILSLHSGRVDDIVYKNLLGKELAQRELLSDAISRQETRYPTRLELLDALNPKNSQEDQ